MLDRSKIRRLTEARTLSQEEDAGELNVVPFLDVIINILIFVLATIAVTFTATIEIKTPKASTLGGTGSGRELTVVVVNDGFALKAAGGNVATGCSSVGTGIAVPKRDGVYDFVTLGQCVAKLNEALPAAEDSTQIYVTANPGVDYKTIVGVIDAVKPVFPDVSLRVPR